MIESAEKPRVTVWTDARHAAVVAQVLGLMRASVDVVGLGGERDARVDELGRRLGCPAGDDLRKLLVEHPAPFVLLASMDGVSRDDVIGAVTRGSTVLAMEPVAAGFDELPVLRSRSGEVLPASTAAGSGSGRVIPIPAFTQMPGWTSAAEPMEVLGSARLISMTSFGVGGDCSLFARLYDAFGVMNSVTPMPESVDAMLAGDKAEAPESLRGMTGHLGALARMADGATGVLQVSDSAAGIRGRQLTIMGDRGEFHAGDLDYELSDAEGQPVDRKQPGDAGGNAGSQSPSAGFAELVAWQWKRLLQRPPAVTGAAAQIDDTQVLACCLACLLSARTGQPESPAKLMALRR